MSESLTRTGGRSVLRMERRLRHAPEAVWRALTEPAGLDEWFPGCVRPDLAARTVTYFDQGLDAAPTGEGRITDLEPPRVLAFTWDTDHLRWEVHPDPAGSRLVLVHTFDDHYGAASFASGWSACLTGLEQVLDGRPVEAAGRHVAEHEAFVTAFGLDEGVRTDGPDGWSVRFERQLTVPAEEAWARLAGSEPVAGGEVPAGAVAEEFPPVAVTQVDPPRLLEYSWAVGPVPGRAAAVVRWELGEGTGHGARLVLTQTGPADADVAAATALAAWRARIAALAEQLSAVARP